MLPIAMPSPSDSPIPLLARAGDVLVEMEQRLLELDFMQPEPESLDALWQAAAWLSDTAAAAAADVPGLPEPAALLAQALEMVRQGKVTMPSEMIDAFLAIVGLLKAMLATRQDGPAVEPTRITTVTARLQQLLGTDALPDQPALPHHRNPPMICADATTAADSSTTQEYLTFRLSPEEYAIDILKVQEIRSYEQPTTLANTPAFIKGVINLRGTIVPIIDLRIKFGVGEADYTPFTVVIILSIGNRLVGIVVDGVSDVTTLRSDQIQPAPAFSASVDTRHINGLGTLGERMLIVVDIERLMFSGDMALVHESAPLS